jgi:hypothetical protein
VHLCALLQRRLSVSEAMRASQADACLAGRLVSATKPQTPKGALNGDSTDPCNIEASAPRVMQGMHAVVVPNLGEAVHSALHQTGVSARTRIAVHQMCVVAVRHADGVVWQAVKSANLGSHRQSPHAAKYLPPICRFIHPAPVMHYECAKPGTRLAPFRLRALCIKDCQTKGQYINNSINAVCSKLLPGVGSTKNDKPWIAGAAVS